MGCDDNLFQGCQTNMILQLKNKEILFITKVHCFAHKTNLMVVTLSKLDIVKSLKVILKALYVFSTHSSKKFMEFQKLVNLINTKGNKLFQNVKTHQIFMFFSKKAHICYKFTLIMKMHAKRYKSKVVLKNVNALHDIKFILGSLAFVLCLNVCMH